MTVDEQLTQFRRFGCKKLCQFYLKTGRCAYGKKSDCDQIKTFENLMATSTQDGFLDMVSLQTLVDALRRRGLTGELRESKIVII